MSRSGAGGSRRAGFPPTTANRRGGVGRGSRPARGGRGGKGMHDASPRDFVTDPGTQSVQVGEAANSLIEVLKKTRLELAPEQQDMIDGVTERLSTYRSGIERISTLINRRAELIVALQPLRDAFDKAVA